MSCFFFHDTMLKVNVFRVVCTRSPPHLQADTWAGKEATKYGFFYGYRAWHDKHMLTPFPRARAMQFRSKTRRVAVSHDKYYLSTCGECDTVKSDGKWHVTRSPHCHSLGYLFREYALLRVLLRESKNFVKKALSYPKCILAAHV